MLPAIMYIRLHALTTHLLLEEALEALHGPIAAHTRLVWLCWWNVWPDLLRNPSSASPLSLSSEYRACLALG